MVHVGILDRRPGMTFDQQEKLKALLLEALVIADKMEGRGVLALYIVQALDTVTPKVRR
jgi:hypothetical protein